MNNQILASVEKGYLNKKLPDIRPGDNVKVHIKIAEGEKERTQVIEGIVIARKGSGTRESITVRKISYSVGVEMIFPLYSPKIEKIVVTKRSKVRKAKLYYLREKSGKSGRLKEKKIEA